MLMNNDSFSLRKLLTTLLEFVSSYGVSLLAIIGFMTAVSVVRAGNQPPPMSSPVAEPATAAFESSVAGAGIVEASGENIAIASQVPGVIEQIFVAVGQHVAAGDPLFQIDTRSARALTASREAAVDVARAQLADAKSQNDFIVSLPDKRAVSVEEFSKRRNALAIAQAKLSQSEQELTAARTELEKLTVRAPKAGTVLRINTRPGEFAAAQNLNPPLMVFGNTDRLWVRVDVDENDAWRVKPGARATGSLRGNGAMKTDLEFVRFEPYVIPKKSLTGDNAERVDTRVLQILYAFNPSALPVFVGQLMDIYIEGEKNG